MFNEVTWVTARKQHRCEWCYQSILLGEKHRKFVGVWDGEFQNWRMHEECYQDADINGYLDEGFAPGGYARPMTPSKGMTE